MLNWCVWRESQRVRALWLRVSHHKSQYDPQVLTAFHFKTKWTLARSLWQWRRQDFVTGGSGSIGGLEYEVPQSRLYCLCINVALCSMALQCICRVIRRSSMTMKAHTYYIIFGRPPIGGKLPPFPLAAPLVFDDQSSRRGKFSPETVDVCLEMFGCLQAERTIAIRKRKFLNKYALCRVFVAIAKTELESCCTDV